MIKGLAINYRTDRDRGFWLARVLPGAVFGLGMLGVVLRAGWNARRGRYSDADWVQSSVDVVRWLEVSGVRIQVDGMEKAASRKGPFVFVGNHMSTLEAFVLPSLLRPLGPVTFVVKKNLVEYPVFRHVMTSRDPIVVGRVNPREDLRVMLEEGEKRLSAGISVIVFPQTTRRADFDPEHFNSIGVKLARRCGVPVVPMALLTDAWRNGRICKDFGGLSPDRPVRFAFGQPVSVEGSGREVHDHVVEFIQNHLHEWQKSTDQG